MHIVSLVVFESFEILCFYRLVILHLLVTVWSRLVVYRIHASFVFDGKRVGGIWKTFVFNVHYLPERL